MKKKGLFRGDSFLWCTHLFFFVWEDNIDWSSLWSLCYPSTHLFTGGSRWLRWLFSLLSFFDARKKKPRTVVSCISFSPSFPSSALFSYKKEKRSCNILLLCETPRVFFLFSSHDSPLLFRRSSQRICPFKLQRRTVLRSLMSDKKYIKTARDSHPRFLMPLQAFVPSNLSLLMLCSQTTTFDSPCLCRHSRSFGRREKYRKDRRGSNLARDSMWEMKGWRGVHRDHHPFRHPLLLVKHRYFYFISIACTSPLESRVNSNKSSSYAFSIDSFFMSCSCCLDSALSDFIQNG